MMLLLQACLSNVVVAACLAVPAVLMSRFGRNPHLARGLWLLVLLKLVAPPIVPLQWPTNVPEASPLPDNLAELDLTLLTLPVGFLEPTPEPEIEEWKVPWLETACAIWLAGSVGIFVLTVRRVIRFDRLVSETAIAPAAVQAEARRLAAELGIATVPLVHVVEARLPPLLWHFRGRPVILLPAGLLERIGLSAVSSILAHELVHLRRRDHWLRRFEMLVLAIYWWLPLAWWARRELRVAEEQCCDSAVVGRWPERAQTYAETLWQAIDWFAEQPAAVPCLASGFGNGASLKRRFIMLTRFDIPTHLNRVSWIVLATVGLLVLPATAQQPAIETPPVESAPAPSELPPPVLVGSTAYLPPPEPSVVESTAVLPPAESSVVRSIAGPVGSTATLTHSVEDRVGRLEQMMSEVLAAVKQGPKTASRSPASSYYSGASPRSPASSYYSAASQGQTLPALAVLSQLEGNALARAISDLESQVQVRRKELRRMEQLIQALQQMDGGPNTAREQ